MQKLLSWFLAARHRKRRFVVVLAAGLALVAFYSVAAWRVIRVADAQWFDPAPEAYGNWHPAGLKFEDVWFRSKDGTRLNGWYVPHERPRAVVLFLHGSSANVTYRADVLRRLHDRFHVAAMTFDYRGFGRSQGKITEAGLLADARAARRWLARRAAVDEREIVLVGRSLGAAVAVDLATDGAAALVLENGFTSLPDVAKAHYHWLPIAWFMRFRLDAASKIGRYDGPLLQVHAAADHVVPLSMARRLFWAASGPRQFIIAPKADHTDPPCEAYYLALGRLLDRVGGR